MVETISIGIALVSALSIWRALLVWYNRCSTLVVTIWNSNIGIRQLGLVAYTIKNITLYLP